jgi:hypothetical protein
MKPPTPAQLRIAAAILAADLEEMLAEPEAPWAQPEAGEALTVVVAWLQRVARPGRRDLIVVGGGAA